MFGSALGVYGSRCLNTPLTNFWHHSGAALPIVVVYYKQRRTSGIFLNVYSFADSCQRPIYCGMPGN